MALKSGIVTFSFSRSITFALCLTLILSGTPLPARTQSNQPAQEGMRTTEAPSKNLPDLDATRGRKEPEVKKPEPVPAARCRHWDKKCKDLKKEKVSGLFNRTGHRSLGLIAAASSKSFGKAFDWRASAFAFDSPAGEQTEVRSTKNRRSAKPGTLQKSLPLAFASSLLPAMAFQTYSNAETARVEPQNRTGNPGEDLLSGNFNFNIPIVNLPGRAGHDLNLTLAYNSKVWIKSSNYTIRFDMDYGWPSPGFRLGFPTFYGPYLNSTTNRNSFGLILPSGRAVELRQVSGLTEIYDAEDGSYIRFKHDLATGNYILTMPDGTQYIYGTTLDIKDRNGNLITATYNADGLMDTITDTLGCQILFQYGSFYELLKIQQLWNGVSKDLASFDYDSTYQLMYRFTSGLVPDNVTYGQTLPVMYQMTMLDNSRYKFLYNTYGQINRFEKYGGLNFLRAWTQYNLPTYSDGTTQSGCPGFTTRTDWAYDWSAAGGVATSFLFNQSVANPDAASEAANPNLICGQATAPDGTTYKELYYGLPATSARWRYGLLKMTQAWTDGNTIERKMTKTQYDQPCGSGTIGNYLAQCNPRVIENNIYDNTDSNNSTWEKQRRTTVSYAAGNPTDYNLPADVYEYDYPATTTVLRRTHTDYNQTSTYINKRLINLPTASYLYDGSNVLNSKVEYVYDESGYLQAHSTTPIRRDTANYGIGYLAGRGNLTTVRRYNVSDNTFVEAKTGYYVTGTVAFSRDALNHQTTVDYTDGFCAITSCAGPPQNKNSYAYPTKVTDPDNYSSYVYYNFDIGAPVKTINPKGASVLREYDGYGRLWQVTNQANGAYTRYDFDVNQYFVKSYSTIQDGQGEFYSITTFDGHDRPRATVGDHPGSAGGYKGVYNVYDTVGRQSQVSNPTEINSSWTPAGDDVVNGSNGGWRWSLQSYDWKGRPLVSTNTDGTTKIAAYTGCGCAGGDAATLTDEGTLDNGVAKRRQQTVLKDVLGRVVKTQVLNWENGTPYSTTINTYNVRDQITSVKEYSGTATGTEACPSATCQITNTTYDGHGRIWKQRRPVETADNVYLYNNDDTLWKMTDPRGVNSTYSYNNRGLVTGVTYDSMPNVVLPSPLPARPVPSSSVTFGYDEVGNRTWMDDAPGRVDYTYDQLSRLKQEVRLFDTVGITRSFTLKYEYNLAGQLAQITDPWNATVTYNRDKAGRETGATGTGYKDKNQWTNRDVNTFASNIKYRAWDGIKQFTNGSLGGNNSFAMGYDKQLHLTSFTGGGRTTQHDYYNDGLVKQVTDLYYGSNFLRTYQYDHVQQLKTAQAGGTPQTSSSPYSLTYAYDAWGNTTSRTGSHWSNALTPVSTTYTNNRAANATYDAAGYVIGDTANYVNPFLNYNAGGQLFTEAIDSGTPYISRWRENYYDGDGAKVFTATYNGSNVNGSYSYQSYNYLIRSSVLGGKVIAEFNDSSTPPVTYSSMSYVYLKGVQLGYQKDAHQTTGDKNFVWTYHNPTVGTYFAESQLNNSNNQQVNVTYGDMTFDPVGSFVGLFEPIQIDIPPPFVAFSIGQTIEDYNQSCYADGVRTSCGIVQSALRNGWGVTAPWNNTGSVWSPTGGSGGKGGYQLTLFTVDWDNGFYGFVPVGANYSSGNWYLPANEDDERSQSVSGGLQKIQEVPANVRRCDDMLASLFGGKGAVAQTTVGRNSTTGDYSPGDDHQDDGPVSQGGAIHIYAPAKISGDVGAFIPSSQSLSISGAKYRLTDRDYEDLHFFEFAYRDGYGNYKAPFTVYVLHLKDVDLNGQLNIDKSVKNASGSIKIGNIGGPGGVNTNPDGTPWSRHVHITTRKYLRGDGIGSGEKSQLGARIDIRKIFCSGF